MFGTTGWLFADLMLALAVAFLVATTVGQPRPAAAPATSSTTKPTPTTSQPRPTPTRTPTPTPNGRTLELNPVVLNLTIDSQGLLAGNGDAAAALQQQVHSDPRLAGREAGLVLTFGGAQGNVAQGMSIAKRTNEILSQIGAQGFVFLATVYRPYIGLNSPPSQLTIDVYLFKL